jgi:hypothetical protein
LAKRTVKMLLIVWAAVFLAISCSAAKHKAARERNDESLRNGDVIVKIERIAGSSTRLGQVMGVIDAPRERVWLVIGDYNEQKNFMPNLLESFVIRPEALDLVRDASPEDLASLESRLKEYKCDEVAGKVVYVYGAGDFPWPMPDKRYILKIERDPDHYTTHANMVIGQMKVNEAFWELEPYGTDGSKTLATYRILLDTGMPLPGFAINMAASSSLPEVIKAVRRKVKDAKYKPS